ncbi:right-handed parallel beta-helix repeat-containing protein [Candidatus Micrarchaeota archaeon]|nr:right-handed parallel beta-helix repeat-containing protein [Candidatus Micrarchaeota archaeon]
MLNNTLYLAVALFLLIINAGFPYELYGGALYCNTTCDDCEDALNNGTYTMVYLNSSLYSPGATCINNPAGFENKTFDCQGNTITGNRASNRFAIYYQYKNNVTLQNCIVQSFYDGYRLYRTNYSLAFNMTSYNNSNDGARLYMFSNGTFSNNTHYNNSHEALAFDYSSGNLISNSTFANSTEQGIEFQSSSWNTVCFNTFYGSNAIDFHWQEGNSIGNIVHNNTASEVKNLVTIYKGLENILVNNTMDSARGDYWAAPIMIYPYADMGGGTDVQQHNREQHRAPRPPNLLFQLHSKLERP